MADKGKLNYTTFVMKHGLYRNLPKGKLGEPLYCTDTHELYIGQGEDRVARPLIAQGGSSTDTIGMFFSVETLDERATLKYTHHLQNGAICYVKDENRYYKYINEDWEETWNNGLSAYEVSVANGFIGGVDEWEDSLKGERGDTGDTPSITIGTVTTVESYESATATISGETPNLVLSLRIPKGEKGIDGKNGKNGENGVTPNISIGTITTLAPGTKATASITGTTPNLTLNLGIPKGEKGTDGNNHTHSNKGILDTITAGNVHTHTNKSVIDTITVDNVHTHSNKSVIDAITSDMTAKWNKSIPFEDSYVSDCNAWLTNGYTKTNTDTANHPSVCTGADRWGVLFYISENEANRTGTQMYFPIDGTYAGKVFIRSLLQGTPSEWNMLAVFDDTLVTNNISRNRLTLTTDKLQYTAMATGTTIVLPTVTTHTVIHLYFTTGNTAPTITFPSIAWQKIPSINANKKYEFIFTYVNSTVGWLGGYVEYSL